MSGTAAGGPAGSAADVTAEEPPASRFWSSTWDVTRAVAAIAAAVAVVAHFWPLQPTVGGQPVDTSPRADASGIDRLLSDDLAQVVLIGAVLLLAMLTASLVFHALRGEFPITFSFGKSGFGYRQQARQATETDAELVEWIAQQEAALADLDDRVAELRADVVDISRGQQESLKELNAEVVELQRRLSSLPWPLRR